MRKKNRFFPAVILTGLAAVAIGFGASHVWDHRTIDSLKTERDQALDCRRSGTTVSPCPVLYRSTRIEWRDKIRTIETPDRKQAGRIAFLSVQLADARRTIRNLERSRAGGRGLRVAFASAVQNGSMAHPYIAADRCPSGAVVLYDAGLASGSIATRRSGDPGVCYVRTSLHDTGRLALSSQRH